MKGTRFSACNFFSVVLFILTSTLAVITTACGNLPGPPPPAFSGNTNVTVLLSSMANDQLSQFGLTFNSLSLTNKAGKVFTLLASPQGTEFIHLNGATEPLVTVSIPEGVYTSATAKIGYAYFTCLTVIPPTGLVPGGLLTATFAYGSTPDSQVSLHLPSPLTISGENMGVLLKMATSQSETLGSCYAPAGSANPYSITPTFEVMPVSFSGQSADSAETGLNGEISTVSAGTNSFTVTLADGQTLSAVADSNTVFQGLADVPGLTAGMFVNMDAVIQPDGSQLATRVAVADLNTTNVSMLAGPVMLVAPHGSTGAGPVALALGTLQQGFLQTNHEAAVWMQYDISAARFEIVGQLSNLQTLPFVPSFNSSNMVPGQNINITTDVPTLPTYLPASTVTLMPQTVNGTVVASSTSGTFSIYTVSLAAYDLFPTLAFQQGQTTLLTSPSQIEVYVDSNTQKLNSSPLIPGSVLRFRGLVFNDNGTLRMDCAQVFDGVAE